jgi:hypothetical protein
MADRHFSGTRFDVPGRSAAERLATLGWLWNVCVPPHAPAVAQAFSERRRPLSET